MSDNDRPDLRAFRELESLVRNLGEELATFRRRALVAEAQLKESGHSDTTGKGVLSDRLAELESENETLRKRLDLAEDRVRQMTDRVRFLRQQFQATTPAGTGRS